MLNVSLQSLIPHSLLGVLGPDFIEAVLDDVASMARAKWIRLAQQELTSSKRDYIDGIQEVSGSGMERMITLLGVMPVMVELGTPPFDMRQTLLTGGKGKVSKAGHRYRSIPFRHGTPTSKGQAGAAMGSQYGPVGSGSMSSSGAAQLGKSIYDQAKRLRGKSSLGRRTTYVDQGGAKLQVPKLAPHHSTDIFAGMRRTTKQYKVGSGAQYTTFRTISEANPAGWIHPGIRAHNFRQEVERHVNEYMTQVVSTALRRAFSTMGVSK